MPRVGLAGPQEVEESMEKREKVVRQTLGEDGWGPLFPSNKWLTKFIPHSCPLWRTNFDCGCPLKWSEEGRSSEEGAGDVSERQETLHLLSSRGEITRYTCNEWEKWSAEKCVCGGVGPRIVLTEMRVAVVWWPGELLWIHLGKYELPFNLQKSVRWQMFSNCKLDSFYCRRVKLCIFYCCEWRPVVRGCKFGSASPFGFLLQTFPIFSMVHLVGLFWSVCFETVNFVTLGKWKWETFVISNTM